LTKWGVLDVKIEMGKFSVGEGLPIHFGHERGGKFLILKKWHERKKIISNFLKGTRILLTKIGGF